METQSTFDPSRHLISLNGEQYLEVKWRLVWLRNIFPDAAVSTELMDHTNGKAIFRAIATLPSGASATGWGSESAEHFPEYIEAAETKALGRCLAALGFGSQFCSDFDLAENHGVLVDSPVRPVEPANTGSTTVNFNQPVTAKQHALIQVLTRDLRLTADDVNEIAHAVAGIELAGLNRRQASGLIDELRSRGSGKAAEKVS